MEELRFSYRAHSSARLSVSLLPERILWVLYLGAPLVSQKAHGFHGKITRFQIKVTLGATKSEWSGSWIQFWVLPKTHHIHRSPPYPIASTASACTLLFLFLNLSVNTFCSKRTLLFCFASFELSLIVSSQTNSFWFSLPMRFSCNKGHLKKPAAV